MRDGRVLRLVKWVARTAARVDLSLGRKFASPARYRLTGSCNGCGKCCEAPTMTVGRLTWRISLLRLTVLWWQRVVNGFVLQSIDPRFRAFTFKCTHYDPVTKCCDSYESRPLWCRDYPTNLTYGANPVLFDECSHGVLDVNAERFREALKGTALSPEKREELERKLHLREPNQSEKANRQ